MMTKWQRFVQAGAFARSDNLPLFLDATTTGNSSSLGIIVSILLFVIVNQLWRAALTGTSPSSLGKPLRFVCVNDLLPPDLGIAENSSMYLTKNLLTNLNTRNSYLQFAKDRGIAGQFLGVGPFLQQPNLVAGFLSDCKSVGIRSSFMCAETDALSSAKTSIQQTLDMIEKLDYGLWPESIQTNMESTAWANKDVTPYLTAHLEAKDKLTQLNAKHGASLRLAASVFWWWTWWGDAPTPPTVVFQGKKEAYGEALIKAGIDCAPQCHFDFVSSGGWQSDVFPMWVKLAKGTGAVSFPTLRVNRSYGGSEWIPSSAVPSSQVESKIWELAQLSAQAGADDFGGLAVFDAVSYAAFVSSPP